MQDGHVDATSLADSLFPPSEPPDNDIPPSQPLLIKLPPSNSMNLRRSTRHSSAPSGSEYNVSEKSVEMEAEELKEETPPVEMTITKRGRLVKKNIYVESSDADGDGEADPDAEVSPIQGGGRKTRRTAVFNDEEEEEEQVNTRLRKGRKDSFIATDDDEKPAGGPRYQTRNRSKPKPQPNGHSNVHMTFVEKELLKKQKTQAARAQRASARNRRSGPDQEDFQPPSSSAGSVDADGSLDDALHDTSDLEMEEQEPDPEPEPEDETDGKPYALRQRKEINYAIPPPLEEMPRPPPRPNGGRTLSRNGKGKKPGWSMSGAELGRYMGMPPADDSVSMISRLLSMAADFL